MADRKPDIEFRIVPAEGGFWLTVSGGSNPSFQIEYFAMGGVGYQRRGEIEGAVVGGHEVRIFVDLGFDPVVAGITSADWRLAERGPGEEDESDMKRPPRRKPGGAPDAGSPDLHIGADGRRRRRRPFRPYPFDDPYGFYGPYGLIDAPYGIYDDPYGFYGADEDPYGILDPYGSPKGRPGGGHGRSRS